MTDAKTDNTKATASKPAVKVAVKDVSVAKPKPAAKDDLKSLPLAEVEKKLGSSPDGLTQAEAEKRLTQYGPNEIEEKKTNPLLKFLTYFWGPIPWMIEVAVILSGGRPALAGLLHHPPSACSPTPSSGSGKNARRATPLTP